ncbi:MAG: sporulation protein YabP [Bacillaceae bacterium]|nr:sporulation protein YabP [Bacillaceae bacterium]
MVENQNGRHEMMILNRNTVRLSGVLNVESFDSEEFLLETECGYLAIRGQNLHMKNMSLETGEVDIEGTVYDMSYIDEGFASEKTKGLFGRLFK